MLCILEVELIQAKIIEYLYCDLLIRLLLKSSLATDQFPVLFSDALIRALSKCGTPPRLKLCDTRLEPCLRMMSNDSENLDERIELYCALIILCNVSNLYDVLLEVELKELIPFEGLALLDPGLI